MQNLKKNPDWSITATTNANRQITLRPATGKSCELYEALLADESLSDFERYVALLQAHLEADAPLLDWDADELEDFITWAQPLFRVMSLRGFYRAVYWVCRERIDASLAYWETQPLDKLMACCDVVSEIHKEQMAKMPKAKRSRIARRG